jgi:hypothetical protein
MTGAVGGGSHFNLHPDEFALLRQAPGKTVAFRAVSGIPLCLFGGKMLWTLPAQNR